MADVRFESFLRCVDRKCTRRVGRLDATHHEGHVFFVLTVPCPTLLLITVEQYHSPGRYGFSAAVHDYRLDQVQIEVPPVVSAADVPFQLPVADQRKRAPFMTNEAPAAKRSKEDKHASAQATANESQKKKKKKKKNKDKDKASPKTNKEGQPTMAAHESGIKAKFGRVVKGMSLPKAFSKGKQGKRPPSKPKSAFRDKNKGKAKAQKRPAQQSTQSSPGDKNWHAMRKEGKLNKAPAGGSTKRKKKPKKSKKASKSDA